MDGRLCNNALESSGSATRPPWEPLQEPTLRSGKPAGDGCAPAHHELANLELLPETLNRRKSDKVGERQLDYAWRFQATGLLKPGSFARVQAAYRPAGTADLELAAP